MKWYFTLGTHIRGHSYLFCSFLDPPSPNPPCQAKACQYLVRTKWHIITKINFWLTSFMNYCCDCKLSHFYAHFHSFSHSNLITRWRRVGMGRITKGWSSTLRICCCFGPLFTANISPPLCEPVNIFNTLPPSCQPPKSTVGFPLPFIYHMIKEGEELPKW